MAPVQSRLILAIAVPTVLVFTLYWLKRLQLRIPRPPTDPGGETKEEADPDLGTLLLDKNKKVCIFVNDSYLEIKPDDLQLDLVPIEKDTLKSLAQLTENVVPACEKVEVVCIQEDFSEIKEEIDTGKCDSKQVEGVNEPVCDIKSDIKLTEVVEEIVSLITTEITESPTVQKELANSEPEIKPGSPEPILFEEKEQASLEPKKEASENLAANCDSLETESIESDILPVKEEVEQITMESSERREDLTNKLNKLELGGAKEDKKRQEMGVERDSANHSPSEVMLGSPSMSNFSDAHSEGSSDSGKGLSDPATSPSRTPAGGSSLAGDVVVLPALYEFVLPQTNVGRLIGRHGSFLQEIRSTTNTNVFIKRHPDSNKLKICAIEGTQQDIDKALAKIRQKFPLRRFPQLTLEKVSFVSLNTPPLKPEDFHLHLVEGVNNDVILSSLISAGHCFVQQPSHPSYLSLGNLNRVMNEVYTSAEAPAVESPIKDAVCAAPTMGGWYRAQIVDVDEGGETCTVRFLDYGGYLSVQLSSLRQIRGDLLMLPFQAVECYLANVAPKEEEGWSEEAKLFVHSLTHGRILQAQIYDYAEDSTPLVYLYTTNGSEVVLVNEQLVSEGYGVLTVGGITE